MKKTKAQDDFFWENFMIFEEFLEEMMGMSLIVVVLPEPALWWKDIQNYDKPIKEET